jgi:hypothetical protein
VFFPQGFITPELLDRIKRRDFRRRKPPSAQLEPESAA